MSSTNETLDVFEEHIWGSRSYGVFQECGALKIAQQIADHESSLKIGVYDRRDDDVNLDQVERISI